MSRRILLVASVLAATVLAGSGVWYVWWREPPPSPPEVALDGADPAVVQVVQAAREKVKHEPRSGAAWGRLAMTLQANDFRSEAEAAYRQAARLDPRNPSWPYHQAQLVLTYDPHEALRLYREALARCPDDDPRQLAARLRVGELLLQVDETAGAEENFRHILKRNPDDPRARLGLGVAALSRDDLVGALEQLLPCQELPDVRKQACAHLSTAYRRLGDEKRAAEYARRAATLPEDDPWDDPFSAELVALDAGKAELRQHAGKLDEAGRFQEEIRLLQDALPEGLDDQDELHLATARIKAGDLRRGEQALRGVLARRPDLMQGHYFLSVACFEKAEQLEAGGGDPVLAERAYREAADEARKVLAIKPDHAFSYLFLGMAERRLGRPDEALACFRKAVDCRPDLAYAHLSLAESLIEHGLDVEGLAQLAYALDEKTREDKRVRETIARLYATVVLRAAPFGRP
jgi:tetratricopeptide (TPR) repeat protein